MTAFETTAGTDVEIVLAPDTPAQWRRLPPGMLAAVDQLASTLTPFGDWRIDLALGPNTTLTAQPAADLTDDDPE